MPLIQAAPARVHEEVTDRGQLQPQLLGDGDLQVFGWPVVLSEDGQQGPALEVREDQSVFLGSLVPVQLSLFLFLAFTRCEENREC